MKRFTIPTISFLLFVSTTSWADYQVTWVDPNWQMLVPNTTEAFGDFDGDGAVEVVGYNHPLARVEICDAMTGTVEFFIQPITVPRAVQLIDLDGDGLLEIMIAETNNSIRTIDFIGAATAAPHPERSQGTLGAFPNPAHVKATMAFSLDAPGEVDLRVYDVSGRLISQVAAGHFDSGYHEVPWNGRNPSGQKVAAGTYFYKLTVDGRPAGSKKVVMIE